MQVLAEIITIGDEILIGQIVDTNSAWMARHLHPVGVEIKQITSVSDDKHHIVEALENALSRADIVLITGGLGPTRDDITKSTLADYFQSAMYLDPKALADVTAIFARRNVPMIDLNEQQALLPEKCTPIYNSIGTAPGMLFEKDGKIIISLPGVPSEMKKMMELDVIPYIKEHFTLPFILHKTFLTAGIGESFLAKRIEHLEDLLPAHIKLAYLPDLNTVRLRFSARGTDKALLEKGLAEVEKQLVASIAQYIVATDDLRMEEAIGQLLAKKQATVSTAESCTGGSIARLLTAVPGSSAYFSGGIVAYANHIKEQMLEVSTDTLQQDGAVSEAVVRQMSENIRRKMATTYGISTSGIAGPDGGTAEKPVGTVWISVAGPGHTVAEKYLLHGSREQVTARATLLALDMLRKLILTEPK